MAAVIDAEEFARFVAEMPRDVEAQLIVGSLPTQFFKARQRGWSFADLLSEGRRCIEQGLGIGVLNARFHAMSENAPVNREGHSPSSRPERTPYRRHEAGEPIPWEWHKERMELMRRIGKGGWTPDAAEREMTALIARQKASRDVDPFA